MIVLNVILKLASKLKIKTAKSDSKNISKSVLNKAKSSVKRFLFVSKPFSKKYAKTISRAAHLIAANMKLLKAGEVVKKEGFEIMRASTGKGHKGINNEITLSVSFEGKTCFVKIGKHTGEESYLGYKKAKSFFDNRRFLSFFGYKAKMVPYHLFYSKSTSSKSSFNGVLVSDFFSKEQVRLVEDIRDKIGIRAFERSRLGAAIDSITSQLLDRNIYDAGTHNAFLDKKSKTIYFFDLYFDKSVSLNSP